MNALQSTTANLRVCLKCKCVARGVSAKFGARSVCRVWEYVINLAIRAYSTTMFVIHINCLIACRIFFINLQIKFLILSTDIISVVHVMIHLINTGTVSLPIEPHLAKLVTRCVAMGLIGGRRTLHRYF